MATEKKINSRIQQKHDVAANWAKATNFIPKKGEIIIYDAEYNASGAETQAVRFKIGDGSKTVSNLPFAVIDYGSDIETLEQEVANNSTAIGTLQENTVPKTRKINNKALSSDITLGAADVGVNETAFPGLKKTGTVTGVKMNGTTKNPSSGVVDLGTVITAHQSLDGKQDKITSSNKLAASLVSGLAKVATSGSYNDLEDKPSIPDVSGKQDKLTAGSNITISGNTISATVPTDVVKYTAQTLTTAQKSQARSNIGAGTSSFSGSYNDLLDKPSFDKLTRIQKQAYTGGDNTVQYFKLASFPVYNSGGNYASFIITGRMGGWQSDNMSFVNMILYNRNGEGGGYINVANSAFFNLCDIVMYREEDGTSTAYLKVKSYYTFDINVNTYQATNVYTGTDDTPTGTLKWTASEQADRLAVSGGVAYVNGFTLPKQVEINGTVVNPNSAGLVNLGTGFAKTADLPIKSATLSGTTLTITL